MGACTCVLWREQNILLEANLRVPELLELEDQGAAGARQEMGVVVDRVRERRNQVLENLRRENRDGVECEHLQDQRQERRGRFGNCRHCGFYMYVYGYVCSGHEHNACGVVFCYTCHHHRLRK